MTSTANNRLLVVLATFNEIDNLPRLVKQLSEELPCADILVIDDASPDGTGNWCDQARSQYPQLSVIHREGKLGLGSATITGLRWGLKRKYHWIATMDADLSHDPASLKTMFELIQQEQHQDVGVVLGSRYVEGGGTEGWPLTRQLTSRVVNWFSQMTLGLRTKDNSGAFRIYRCDDLRDLNLTTLKSSDYAYLEEILWRLNRQGVKMIEHPILFKNRELGRSKTTAMLGLKVFWQITRMGLGMWR